MNWLREAVRENAVFARTGDILGAFSPLVRRNWDICVLGLCLWTLVYLAGRVALPIPTALQQKRRLSRRAASANAANGVVAMLHAGWVSLGAIYILATKGLIWDVDRQWEEDPLLSKLSMLSTSYFLWDLCWTLSHRQVVGSSMFAVWLLHHVLALVGGLVALTPFTHHPLTVLGLLLEVSTPFMNLRVQLRSYGVPSRGLLFNTVQVLFAFSFLLCRVVIFVPCLLMAIPQLLLPWLTREEGLPEHVSPLRAKITVVALIGLLLPLTGLQLFWGAKIVSILWRDAICPLLGLKMTPTTRKTTLRESDLSSREKRAVDRKSPPGTPALERAPSLEFLPLTPEAGDVVVRELRSHSFEKEQKTD
ncbi:MAG: hypothetical protein MHM6MM_002954 [Cercozoa sp. M6MM]